MRDLFFKAMEKEIINGDITHVLRKHEAHERWQIECYFGKKWDCKGIYAFPHIEDETGTFWLEIGPLGKCKQDVYELQNATDQQITEVVDFLMTQTDLLKARKKLRVWMTWRKDYSIR